MEAPPRERSPSSVRPARSAGTPSTSPARLRETFRGRRPGRGVQCLPPPRADRGVRAGDRLPEDGARRRRVPSPATGGGRSGWSSGRKGRPRSPAGRGTTSSFRPSPASTGFARRWPPSGPGRGSPWPTRSPWSSPGAFLRKEAGRSGARIIPVDCEHSGVFQCLAGRETPIREAGHPDRVGRAVLPDPRSPRSRTRLSPRPSAIRAGRWAAR